MDLGRLLNPRTIAVVGGVEAGRVIEQLDLLGFDGDVWPIHPNRQMVGGRHCHRSVRELPGPPDASFVAIPAAATPDVVAELAGRGSGGVVVYSSGFAEVGNLDLNQALTTSAGEMPLVGPNCYGFVNGLDGSAIWPDVHGLRRVPSGVGIITQSGNIGINLTMARRAVDIGLMVTAGNQAVVDISDLMLHMIGDDRITAIGVQLEDLKDPMAFADAAILAAEREVPIVALKMGTSGRGALVTASHTGALAGETAGYRALFDRYGVAMVEDIPSFLETLKVAGRIPARPRLVSLSSSGGEAAHVADLSDRNGIHMPEFTAEHQATIRSAVDDLVHVANPMDYHTISWGDQERLTTSFGAVLDGPFDVALLVLDFPSGDIPEAWWVACRAFADSLGQALGLIVSTLPENMPEKAQEEVSAMGLVPMLGVVETMSALSAVSSARRRRVLEIHAPGPATEGTAQTMDEARSKAMLREAGIDVPHGYVTDDPASQDLPFPATVKNLAFDHKAEAGAVAVGIHDRAELQLVLERMPAGDRYLVEETITGSRAEVLVSLRSLGSMGWLLTVGTGGTGVELTADRLHALAPVPSEIVLRMLDDIRGLQQVDRETKTSLLALIMNLQELPAAHPDMVEIEVNPVIVAPPRAVAVDAMVSLK